MISWWKWAGVKPISAGSTKSTVPTSAPVVLPSGDDLRIMVGAVDSYIDRSGRTWSPDRFFSGGLTLARPSERVFRTLDPDIYRHLRQGDFRYAIPLQPGSYELHLHFTETGLADFISAESSGEGFTWPLTGNGYWTSSTWWPMRTAPIPPMSARFAISLQPKTASFTLCFPLFEAPPFSAASRCCPWLRERSDPSEFAPVGPPPGRTPRVRTGKAIRTFWVETRWSGVAIQRRRETRTPRTLGYTRANG